MGSVTPFHYAGILQELSLGQQHVLQAQDWQLALGEAATEDAMTRLRNERGNLRAAIAHVGNAFLALQKRSDELTLLLVPQEKKVMEDIAPAIARTISEADQRHLPPDLQTDDSAKHPISDSEGTS